MRLTTSLLLLIATAMPAWAAPQIELELVNRFRLLVDETEQQRFYADLEQRLICGAYKNKGVARYKKLCSPDGLFASDRTRLNYATTWSRKNYSFQPGYVHTLTRKVRLKVTGLPKAGEPRCTWKVNGAELATHSCTHADHSVTFGADRKAEAKVDVVVKTGNAKEIAIQRSFPLRDVVIVTIGDSFLSGEGNPHLAHRVPVGQVDVGTPGKRAEWLDIRCHRSLFTGAAIAAERLARRVATQSVTFVPLACSGADTKEGVLGAYLGRETNVQAKDEFAQNFTPVSPDDVFQTRTLPTQFDVVNRALCANPEPGGTCPVPRVQPDLVVLSTGGNEVGFGDLVRKIAQGEIPAGPSLKKKLEELPTRYQEISDALVKLNPLAVVAVSYMDPTRQFKRINNQMKLVYCDDIKAKHDDATFVPRFATLLGFGVTGSGAKAAHLEVLQPLNERFAAAAKKHGWRMIALAPDIERGHGFCSKQAAWFYSYGDSMKFQGLIGPDKDELHDNAEIGNIPSGAMHPNIFGHFNMAERMFMEFKAIGLLP